MVAWFDRDGRPIAENEGYLRIGDPGYYEVARTVVSEPRVAGWKFEVHTRWLGMNIADQDGKVELFETVVFRAGGAATFTRRYATEAQAIIGHDAVVAGLAAGMTSPLVEHIRSARRTDGSMPDPTTDGDR